MNLPGFLKLTDEECAARTREELACFIHETARKLPEEKREEFLDALRGIGDSGALAQDKRAQSFPERCDAMAAELARIENGELELESEINEEYDDWYNSAEEEFLFSDPDGIGRILEKACAFLYECVDNEAYVTGSETAEILLELEIFVTGEYADCVDEPLSLSEMAEKRLVKIDMKKVLLCALYAEYRASELKDRPNALYWIFSSYTSYGLTLEQLMQQGDGLPEFDQFLTAWISYLGIQTGRRSQKLLNEAMELADDDHCLLENARRYADQHPGLYEKYIKSQMRETSASREAELYAVGQEALQRIDKKYVVRSRIALLMLRMAMDLNREAEQDDCMLEAFRSDSTAANYMRVRLTCHDASKYLGKLSGICRGFYMENKWSDMPGEKGELTENVVDKTMAFMFAFLEGDFDIVLAEGMNVKRPLGWSGSFMKCGLASFLLLLLESEELQTGGTEMCRMVIRHVGNLDFSTAGEADEGKDEAKRFWETFSAWKRTVRLSSEQREAYLKRAEELIELRVQGIMEANRRNYYAECAAYVAALGEVRESAGEPGGRERVMEQYRAKYSRRSAFHQALRAYGMKKESRETVIRIEGRLLCLPSC